MVIGAPVHQLQQGAGVTANTTSQTVGTSGAVDSATSGPTVHNEGFSFSAVGPATPLSLGRPIQPGVPPGDRAKQEEC